VFLLVLDAFLIVVGGLMELTGQVMAATSWLLKLIARSTTT